MSKIETIPCGFCQGRGKDPFELLSKLAKCQVCGGRGKVTVLAPFKKCSVCQGTGVYPHSRLTCLVCGGKGVVRPRTTLSSSRGLQPRVGEARMRGPRNSKFVETH